MLTAPNPSAALQWPLSRPTVGLDSDSAREHEDKHVVDIVDEVVEEEVEVGHGQLVASPGFGDSAVIPNEIVDAENVSPVPIVERVVVDMPDASPVVGFAAAAAVAAAAVGFFAISASGAAVAAGAPRQASPLSGGLTRS